MREIGTVADAFRRTAHRDPDAPAVDDGERTRSWREHAGRVRGTAAGLHALGVAPGDVLAIEADEALDAAVAGLAVLAIGGAIACHGTGDVAGFVGRDVVEVRGTRTERAELVARGEREDASHPERFDRWVDERRPTETALVACRASGGGGGADGEVLAVDHRALVEATRSVHAALGAPLASRLWHALALDSLTAWVTGPALHAWRGGRLRLGPVALGPDAARGSLSPEIAVTPPEVWRSAVGALEAVADVGAPPGLLGAWRRASRRSVEATATVGARAARRLLDSTVGSRARRAVGISSLATAILVDAEPELVRRSEASGLPAAALLGSVGSGPALLVRRGADGALETRPLPGVAARRSSEGGIEARSPVSGDEWAPVVGPERARRLPPLRGRG